MDMICRLYRLFTIFICLASVVVGFGSFAVLGCKDLWNNTNHLAKWYGHVMRCLELLSPCVSLKIIAHLRTFDSQSDSSIQRPRSIMPNNLQWAVTWELLSQGGEQICELKNKPNKNKPNKIKNTTTPKKNSLIDLLLEFNSLNQWFGCSWQFTGAEDFFWNPYFWNLACFSHKSTAWFQNATSVVHFWSLKDMVIL